MCMATAPTLDPRLIRHSHSVDEPHACVCWYRMRRQMSTSKRTLNASIGCCCALDTPQSYVEPVLAFWIGRAVKAVGSWFVSWLRRFQVKDFVAALIHRCIRTTRRSRRDKASFDQQYATGSCTTIPPTGSLGIRRKAATSGHVAARDAPGLQVSTGSMVVGQVKPNQRPPHLMQRHIALCNRLRPVSNKVLDLPKTLPYPVRKGLSCPASKHRVSPTLRREICALSIDSCAGAGADVANLLQYV
jgi:hypothetical protein